MPEFLNLVQPNIALERLLSEIKIKKIQSEVIDTRSALHRVTADSIYAPHPLPVFQRSSVDGYAVRAMDTYGASENLPVYLTMVGEVRMGEMATIHLLPNQSTTIHTGGMLPLLADAVVMIENTQISRNGEIEILKAVAPGENVINIGEDINAGEEVIPVGTLLRPEEIGGLMALGFTKVHVVCKPKVGIISTGDELIPPESNLSQGKVRDINAFTLGTVIEEHGGVSVYYGIVQDNADVLSAIAERAIRECDVIVITAGSSASARDYTAQVINSLGIPGVLVHGINIRPGKPTILAVCNGKPVIGLPGNPVSALVIARLFVVPVLKTLLQIRNLPGDLYGYKRPSIRVRLEVNIPSQAGREDWVPVKLITKCGVQSAIPLFGKSNLIFTLVRADGFTCIPPDVTGIIAGDWVDVYFF